MATVQDLGDGLRCIDLEFQGQPGVIAAYLLENAGELALIEIGPTSTLDTLLRALHDIDIPPERISKVLVTHIHLDHAGAAGTFIRHFPQAHLYVHEIGAPHMLDPTKLLASAQRIYGDMMGPLWGDFEPVPEGKLITIGEGDTVEIGNRKLDVLYTPGHASHHVVFHDAERGGVFTGDVAAVRLQGYSYIRPPTPPPDIDLELWSESIARVLDLHPREMYLTHFGRFMDVESHMAETRRRLYDWAEIVERALESGQDRPEMTDNLRLHADRELLEQTSDAGVIERYELATPYGMTVDGYLRYFKKRARA